MVILVFVFSLLLMKVGDFGIGPLFWLHNGFNFISWNVRFTITELKPLKALKAYYCRFYGILCADFKLCN